MRRFVLLMIASVLLARESYAQQTVTIAGRLIDSAQLPVSGLQVTALDPASLSSVASVTVAGDGSFAMTVPPAVYTITTTIPPPPLLPTHARVDARAGSVSNLVLRMTAHTPLVPDDPPRAALIDIAAPDAAGDAVVRGAAGAVGPGSFLILVTLDTGHLVTTRAAEDGSFSATTFAPRGSAILIRSDPFGFAFRSVLGGVAGRDIGPGFSLMPGTIVRAPEPVASGAGVPFGRAGTVRMNQPNQSATAAWTFEGAVTTPSLVPGETLRVDGTLRIVSAALPQSGVIRAAAAVRLDRVAGADGSGSLAANTFASTILTPTGLPIERERNGRAGAGLDQTLQLELTRNAPDRAEAVVHFTLATPADLPHGFYVPVVTFFFDDAIAESSASRVVVPIETVGRRNSTMTWLPAVRAGNPAPPRIPVMLLAETLSNGTRGGTAVEDRGRFALSSRLRTNETLIVPRADASGAPLTYRLEPFVPTIGLTTGGRPNLPLVPFRFPSGRLTVRIESPGGAVTSVGPLPFVQARLKGEAGSGTSFRDPFGGFQKTFTELTECLQLTTLDPRMEVQFPADGRYTITLDGAIDDVAGNTWTLGGTYEVNVARLLTIDPAIISGTPFESGDAPDAAVTIAPPVPADVEFRVRFAPGSDPARMIERVVRGRANRFGHFDRLALEDLFREPGEYRVDVIASFTDANGASWMGARTWGSVVAPRESRIVAHGRRAMVNSPFPGMTWFFRTQTEFPTLPHETHPSPPFHSGDVFWAAKSDTAFTVFTAQDADGALTSLLKQRKSTSAVPTLTPGTIDDRASLGELPLFSSRADGFDPHLDPARVDLWGYSYRYVERPSIAVRELVAEDSVQQAYWPFHDQYGAQTGMGVNGDLPNDFKFQFGGVVLRGSALAEPMYAAYGSLFVLVPDDDARGGTRIFPPFQGNGGGASGGPLLTLKGKDIDLFVHLTGTRAGTILHRGERLSLAGYAAPPLPANVEVVLTSPSGLTRTIRNRANHAGWFHNPSNDVVLGEAGVWRMNVKGEFDGRTSAGQVTAPFPHGGVLGSRDGELFFYVVDANAPQLELAPMPSIVKPAKGPVTFTARPPAGLTNVLLAYTVTMPGFILEEGTTASATYTYDAAKLAKDFPNLDLEDAAGYSGADTITISFLLSGTDAGGVRRHFARQVVIRGEELRMPEQKPSSPPLRRRSVR